MEKIKPEVVGVRRVFANGAPGCFVWKLLKIPYLIGKSQEKAHLHPSGRPKFRLVYKKD